MKKMAIISLIFCALVFGYEPTPAPPLDPNDVPFVYDPNLCPSEPISALVLPVGIGYIGQLKVTEPDGEPVSIIFSKSGDEASGIVVDEVPYYDIKDPNDDLGMARKYHFNWYWTPDVLGVHYVNVRVSDPYGAVDERTMVILVKENQPPVITGCR